MAMSQESCGATLNMEQGEKLVFFQLSGNKAWAIYTALFNDVTRDSIANNFVIDVYCRCLQIL